MSLLIAGLGKAVPLHRIAQADAARITQAFACGDAVQERLFQTLYRRTGVETRHSAVLERSEGDLVARQSFFQVEGSPSTAQRMAVYEASSGDLAVRAAAAALLDSATAPRSITHLVTVSCTGFSAPGFDIDLIKQLNLSRDVARTHIGFMGCHGALNGLRAAKAFVEADGSARVLLCALELCSLHHQYGWDPDKIVSNALFADGAAAMVGMAWERGADSDGGLSRVIATGAYLIDDSDDAMTWRIGDHGFMMTLSSRVPDLISEHLKPWLQRWLSSHDLDIPSVGCWAVHPGGPRILSAFAEAVGLPRKALEVSYQVLAEYGNMSSPTVLFILDRLRSQRISGPCVMLGFGPGLAIECALIA